jgi:hypothetical protein
MEHYMQHLEYNDNYHNGLILAVKFRFKGLDWLATDENKVTYILRHQLRKRHVPFKKIHWQYNNGSIGIWHDRKFLTKKYLLSIAYKVDEKITIYEPINDTPW